MTFDSPAWSGWRWTIGLITVVTLARVAFLALASPFELSGDEAQYWDWSRRMELSYYTKGPGVAWAIAASTAVFGAREWTVRLPAVLASAVTALSMAGLAWAMARRPVADRLSLATGSGNHPPAQAAKTEGEGEAGRMLFLAAALFLLTPGFHFTSLLMTIDAPYLACWALALWIGWEAFRDLREGRCRVWVWLLLGGIWGLGALFKYTILVLPLSQIALMTLWWWRRPGKAERPRWRGFPIALAAFGVAFSPVILWNQAHGWPTVRHLFGHLHLPGGDMPVDTAARLSLPLRVLEYFGGQIGFLGAGAVLIGLALFAVHRDARTARADAEPTSPQTPAPWRDPWVKPYLLACGLPLLAFYLLVTWRTEVEVNWPIAAYLSLLILAAQYGATDLAHRARRIHAWRAEPRLANGKRPWRGRLRRTPETAWQVAWHTHVLIGVIIFLAVINLPALAATPVVGRFVPLHRVGGHAERAVAVDAVARQLQSDTGQRPIIIADRYGAAALLAFYLPGRPTVHCAQHQLGDRPTPYDFFDDARLDNPDLHGRPAVLVGLTYKRWNHAFRLRDPDQPIPGRSIYTVNQFGGISIPGASHDHEP